MKKSFSILILLCFVCSAYAFDDLWQKARVFAENSKGLIAGKMTMEIEMTEEKMPDARAGSRMVYISFLGEDGNIVTELISNEEYSIGMDDLFDDEELDEEELQLFSELDDFDDFEEIDSSQGNSQNNPMSDMNFGGVNLNEMFLETNKRNITVNRSRNTKIINDIHCQAYEVRYSPSGKRKDRVEGIVWLEIDKGVPVLSEMSPTRKPVFVKSMDMNTYFGFDEEINVFFSEAAVINTSISFLGKRMNMVMTMTQEDFWFYTKNN